ncbi:MAG: OB-fold nucleic acid binding domain-containing protein, partial [Candidatus Nealsonbacteria bacterium]|nr:OB-fold nucleic acid binding domain-containing protein [Candidatus Nealsonbacteria bacterium]
MQRVINREILKNIGEKVKVCGWVNSRRDHGGIVFFDLRDRSGLLQVVCPTGLAEGIKDEYVLEIEGMVQKRPIKMVNPDLETGEAELKAEKIKILAKAESLPFDLRDLNVSLPTLLDYRPLTLRNKKIQAIFKIEEEIVSAFRKSLKDSGFSEFQSPFIVPVATEGGAELFQIDYYGRKAFLAQSPQLYKQIMVGIFERVFTVAKSFRAEPSITTRHLSEYVSLDVEMGFIESWEDLMDAC